MDADGQLRNLRDFLLVYNRMTEICFQRCSSNFNYRNLTMDEERCTDNCAGKLIRSNHRLMGTYVKLMPAMVQRRMEEMENKAAEAAKAAEAVGPAQPVTQMPTTVAAAQAVTPITDAVPAIPLITDHTHTTGADSPVTSLSTPGSFEVTRPPLDISTQAPASLSSAMMSIPMENIADKQPSAFSNGTISPVPGHQSSMRATQENTPS